MSTSAKTVAYIIDQVAAAGSVSAKPMFGEYGLYCDGKLVGLICDDRLFLKPTPGGRVFAAGATEEPPYSGAKPCLVIDPDRWDDREWLTELFRMSAAELPLPKPKAKRSKQS